jgi:hypothetical protein
MSTLLEPTVREMDPLTKPVFEIDGVRRVGNRAFYSTVAESLLLNAVGELSDSSKLNKNEKLCILFTALDAAAAVPSASDYEERNEVYQFAQQALALRNKLFPR